MSSAASAVLLPCVVFIMSLLVRISPAKALRSGIMTGVGLEGVSLIISMMNSVLTPEVAAVSKRFGLHLSVIDIGWQGASPMAWASPLALAGIPLAISINILMILLRWTKTASIDIWNIWHMIFNGAVCYAVTGSYLMGILGIAAYAAVTYKLGDLVQPFVRDYFELDGITAPHGTGTVLAPFACIVEILLRRIPGIRKINFSINDLQEHAGIFAEPATIGMILGTLIGILARNGLIEALELGIELAAAMVLMPRIVKCIMEGLTPFAERTQEILHKRFGSRTLCIGVDPSVLLGDSQVMTAGLLLIPLTLFIAVLLPGNTVLPMGDLATLSFFISITTAVHGGNLFRTLISGSLIMTVTIQIANRMSSAVTLLATQTGTLQTDGVVTALDQGGSPLTYIWTQISTGSISVFFLAVTFLYLTGVVCMAVLSGEHLKNNYE